MDGRPVIQNCRIEFWPQATDETGAAETTGIENGALADSFVLEPNMEEAPPAPGTTYNAWMIAENGGYGPWQNAETLNTPAWVSCVGSNAGADTRVHAGTGGCGGSFPTFQSKLGEDILRTA